jgi:endonuclease/exonuclease/phosphatase family metal-dependent hydrolase
LFDSNGQVVDAVAYGDSAPPPGTFVGPGVSPGLTGQSIERIPAGCDTDSALDWSVRRDPSPGQITLDGACEETVNAPIAALIPIGEIQGSGPMSPRVGIEVAFRGIVTGRLEDQNLRGVRFHTFFVQDLPGAEDGDPLTSDGIAVFVGARPPAVVPGDVVTVSGLVTEFYGLTEIDHDGLRVTVESRGNSLPPPVLVDPPPDNEAARRYFEPLESMRVTIPTATVAGPTFPGCGFAALSGRESQPRILRHAFEDPAGRLVNVLNTTDVVCDGFPAVAVGDQIDGLVGPLTYHFDLFKIVLQDPSALEIRRVDRPQPMPPTLKDAQFSVATVNMEDLFDGVKDTESDGEPLLTLGQLAAKQKKLSHAIVQTLNCPTILAVQEVEKRELLLEIVANSESQCGFKYLVSHLESPDARGLDLALLTDSRRTSLLGIQLRQSCASLDTAVVDPGIQCPAGERPLFSRPPLEVDLLVDGRPLKIFVNHFKSKREGEFETARWRQAQAAFLAGQVEEILDRDPQANIVVMGDFNDYDRSEVMHIMTKERRLEHVLARLPADEQYSYNFAGAAQLIDWILLSAPLAERVVATTIAHVNADYPYTLTADTGSGISYRASDHDFPIVVLEWAVEESSPAESRAPIPTATASRPPPAATEPVQAAVNVPEEGSKLESPVLLALGAAALLIAALGLVWRRIRQLP